MPRKQYNVFISYSHKDGEVFADELAKMIHNDPKGAGITFWKDYDDMHYGQWSKQIETAIDSVEFLVMIITPEALASSNCKEEWMYARKNGVCILPVNGLPNDISFYNTFPKWLKKQHVYNLENQYGRFVNDLNTKCHIAPVPFMAPFLTSVSNYVQRKVELAKIKNLLLNNEDCNTVSITTSLQGSGGFGKTTLAIALCNDEDIINQFDDGILWITLGQQPGAALNAFHKLYRGLTGEETSFKDVEEAQQTIVQKTYKKNYLFVIDDVWKRQDIKPIIDALHKTSIIITTRFPAILEGTPVNRLKVDEMKAVESFALLTGLFSKKINDKISFEEFTAKLHHWPLLLKLVGAQISSRVEEGESPEQALAYVKIKLYRKGILEFGVEDAQQRDESVQSCLSASLDLLDNLKKERLIQLGIFPANENIPFYIAGNLWQLDDFNTEEMLLTLHKLALIEINFVNKTIRLHDILLYYYHHLLGKDKEIVMHRNLINYLGDFKNLKTAYATKWYIWHLLKADQMDIVINLLEDFDWINTKLSACGIYELLKDYQHIILNANANLIYRGLKLSAYVLTHDRNQLSSQLVGRLGYFKNESLIRLLEKARAWKKQTWIKPIISALTPPGYLSSILKGHAGWINSICIYGNKVISGSDDKTIRIWEIESGECISILRGHTGWISVLLAYSHKVISGSSDSIIRVWDIKSGLCLQTLKGHKGLINFLLIYEGKIISGSSDSTIRMWEIESGQCVQILEGHTGEITSLLVHKNKIISGSADNIIRVWEIESGRCIKTLKGHTKAISSLLVHENKLISGSYDSTICIWEIQSGQCIQTLQGHTGWISSLLVFDNKIISGSADSSIRIWEIQTGKSLRTLQGHKAWVSSLLVHDNKIISGSYDCTIRIWEIQTGSCLEAIEGHISWISSLLIYNNNIISGSADSTIRIWEMESSGLFEAIERHIGWISSLLVHEDKIISGSSDNTIRIWELSSGQCVHTLYGHRGWINSLLVHKNKIISGSSDSTIRIWKISGEYQQTLKRHTGEVTSLLIHDNKIVSGSSDSTICIWEFESGQCIQTLHGHKAKISSLLVYENKIISGSSDSNICIWEIESGRCIKTLYGHTDEITSLLISDNKIISASDDNTIRIWEMASGRCIQILRGHIGEVSSLLVIENKIISGSYDSTIRIWGLESGQCIRILHEHSDEIRSLLVHENNLIIIDSAGLLIIYDVNTFTQLVRYYSDVGFTKQLLVSDNKIIAGDDSGQLHILEIIQKT